jgi:signal transduction histidine kinase
MPETQRLGLDHDTLLAYQRQYHAQKRLADSLFTLFRTLGSALQVERIANVGLLTLHGQLLIKCAGFFQRQESGSFRLLATVGARDPSLAALDLPGDHPRIVQLFQQHSLLDLSRLSALPPAFERLQAHGFGGLFPLADAGEPLGILALGNKIVPGPLTAEDLQILDAFGVVMAVSLRNSMAFQLVETSRNELERLNEMKHEFISHVSHEFRTPLTVLQNILEMTEMEDEIREMSHGALARLEHLIDSVLLLNEINSSGVKLEPQILDGPTWAEQQLRPLLERHGKIEWHDELPAGMLEFDAFKLGVAVDSVVENAFKFGGRQPPEVRFYCSTRAAVAAGMEEARRYEADLEPGFLRPSGADGSPARPNDLMLIVEVRDDGIGIPRAEQVAVFQPFTQAVNSPTRGVRGAGLGLAMAKRIVDAHGGEIFCRSAVGQGTIFYLAVPAAPVHGS